MIDPDGAFRGRMQNLIGDLSFGLASGQQNPPPISLGPIPSTSDQLWIRQFLSS